MSPGVGVAGDLWGAGERGARVPATAGGDLGFNLSRDSERSASNAPLRVAAKRMSGRHKRFAAPNGGHRSVRRQIVALVDEMHRPVRVGELEAVGVIAAERIGGWPVARGRVHCMGALVG